MLFWTFGARGLFCRQLLTPTYDDVESILPLEVRGESWATGYALFALHCCLSSCTSLDQQCIPTPKQDESKVPSGVTKTSNPCVDYSIRMHCNIYPVNR